MTLHGDFSNVGCLRSFLPLDDLKLDLIAFYERPKPAHLNCAKVNEDIWATFVR